MVRIEKFFFSKLIKKSETNKYNKIKWESPYKNLLFAFLLAKIWLFLEILQKIWIFLNFQQNFWSRSFQWCSRSPKQQFLQKSHYWCDPEKLLKMTKIFVEFFDFWPKYRIFWSKNFFTDSTPQDLPLCEKSASYLENLILYRFLSILVENCQFWVTPPYFGPHVLTPLWPGPVPKKFHMIRKG